MRIYENAAIASKIVRMILRRTSILVTMIFHVHKPCITWEHCNTADLTMRVSLEA